MSKQLETVSLPVSASSRIAEGAEELRMELYHTRTVSIASTAIAIVLLAIFSLTGTPAFAQPEVVTNTKHNLSTSGTGTVHATNETQVCVFCHTPHGSSSSAPLWNRYETTTLFSIYPSGGSMQSTVGQPNGSSRLCLSCHDGTAALGVVRSQAATISMIGTGTGGTMPTGASNLGVSLTDDHPVSFTPALIDPEIVLPGPGNPVKLDQAGQVQCRSCHDPHNNQFGSFLVAPTGNGNLCVTCHNVARWGNATHGNTTAPEFSQLVENACSNCHIPHTAASGPRLLRASEENLCFACHDGTQDDNWETNGATNMVTVFQKSSRHNVSMNAGVHEAGEGPLNSLPTPSRYLPEESHIAQRHVECADCHNTHASTAPSFPGQLSATLTQMWGVSIGGTKVDAVSFEYEICFKCHGSSQNLPPNQTNKREKFALTNASFHPVVAPGTNPDVPGLIAPWTVSSTMNCTSCHNTDEDGSPLGPHGSIYEPILKRNFFRGVNQAESADRYGSCYECHDRSTLYNPLLSRFSEHTRHVVTDQLSCYHCHDSHGSVAYSHLIRFDLNNPEISATSTGRLEYQEGATGHGTCFVTCHGHEHNPSVY